MSILWAAFLGLVQGVSEFLPISSSGHLSVLQNLFNMKVVADESILFDVLLHLGTFVSVCMAYRGELRSMFRDVAGVFRGQIAEPESGRLRPSLRLVFMILLATLPLFLLLPIYDKISELYSNTWFIGAAFLLTGGMLYVSDKMAVGRKNARTMTMGNALVVGLCQAVATLPGLSRSGTTITAGLASGFDREFAVKFSFLISLPAVLGANLLSIFKAAGEGIELSTLPACLVGMLVAMVSGYLAIGFIRLLVKRGKFGKFAYYCWAVGLLTLLLSLIF
jgi:undecaprenyl-diphosphatase